MNNKLIIIMVLGLIVAGCAKYNIICDKLNPKFNKIVVSINTDNILILEPEKYGALKDRLQSITLNMTINNLEKIVAKDARFNGITVVANKACTDDAVLVEGQIATLEHRAMNFRHMMLVKIINCSNNAVLNTEEMSGSNHDFKDTPRELSGDLANFVYETLKTCK